MENNTKVRIKSLELEPYVNTSKVFKVINNKPYKDMSGWIEISDGKESIITQERFLEVLQ